MANAAVVPPWRTDALKTLRVRFNQMKAQANPRALKLENRPLPGQNWYFIEIVCVCLFEGDVCDVKLKGDLIRIRSILEERVSHIRRTQGGLEAYLKDELQQEAENEYKISDPTVRINWEAVNLTNKQFIISIFVIKLSKLYPVVNTDGLDKEFREALNERKTDIHHVTVTKIATGSRFINNEVV
jgi:hypothetical protein